MAQSLSSVQKSRVFKVDYFILPLFLVPKLVPKSRSVAQNERKKTPIYIFTNLGSKISKFELKKLEKMKKFPKPKSCRLTSHLLINFILREKSKYSTLKTLIFASY